MRLSDVKGDRTLDVIAECIGPIANIANDKSVKAIMQRDGLRDAKNPRQVVINRAKKMLPQVIKRNKRDIITILAAVKGVSYDEYADEMTLASVISDVVDLLNDEAFVAFFEQSATTEG